MQLPASIKYPFFSILNKDISISSFEAWLYNCEELESIISQENYLHLISLDYTATATQYELEQLLLSLIDKPQFEKWRLLKMLYKALAHHTDLPYILIDLYDLYCKGYHFLYNTGITYCLQAKIPLPKADYWSDLSISEQQDLLNSFFPQLDIELEKTVYWLENNLVIPTGELDESYRLIFIDNRK